MTTAGVVLAGGRSRRMGRDKADLPWAGTTLLGAVLATLGDAVDGALVVVGPAGSARAVPDGAPAARVRVVADPVAGRGPLQGLATGLAAAAQAGAGAAFVASVDLPRLEVAFVRAVLARLADPPGVEVALPVVDGHRQPLAAAYDTALGERAARLLDEGARRPGDLFAVSAVRELRADALLADPALRAADAALVSVRDVDTLEEYRAAGGDTDIG